MRYIGPFFRINSLSTDEIKFQLFHLSKESIKHLELQSSCGILASMRLFKKHLSTNDINILKDFSPLICMYKKGHPLLIKSGKHPLSWDNDSFKKDILPDTNALLTLSILELSKYYNLFEFVDDQLFNLCKIYKSIGKVQLDFYSTHMRSSDGLFIPKKNIGDNHIDTMSLSKKNETFLFSDQAFMMCAYYNYYTISDKNDKDIYKNFALEILNMFIECKEQMYDKSLDECCLLCFAFNIFYSLSKDINSKLILIDLCDILIDKFEEKESVISSINDSSFVSINLFECYSNTGLSNFKDKATDISSSLLSLYDKDKGYIDVADDKKEIKYSSMDLVLYVLNMILHCKHNEDESLLKTLIPNMYKSLIIGSDILNSFPEAPDLNSPERYKNFSLDSDDLIEESKFKLTSAESPESSGLASIFIKNVSYSKKKFEFSHSKTGFDSTKNLLLLYMIIYLFNDDFIQSICGGIKPINQLNISKNNDMNSSNIVSENKLDKTNVSNKDNNNSHSKDKINNKDKDKDKIINNSNNSPSLTINCNPSDDITELEDDRLSDSDDNSNDNKNKNDTPILTTNKTIKKATSSKSIKKSK